jgi:Ubiquitin-activating enzyme E1 FCCH domain
MTELPLIMGPAGLVPTPPATLRQQLVTRVNSTNPGFTDNLPGSLVEDIVSTDVGALIIANQFLVDLINSVSPYGANPFLLKQLGTDIYGIQLGQSTNTSVDLIFIGTPGFIIIPGFIVTDGTYQYVCIDGGIVGSNGQSLLIHAVATQSGTWPVPATTVNGFVTSVPATITLSVFNPTDGIPSTSVESISSFRTRTLTAGLAASTGCDRYLKTLLWNIPGVIQRLVSVQQDIPSGRWLVIVGGGDPYQVAWAIYYALFGVPSLLFSTINIINITNTNPIRITTQNNHNLVTGMIETLNDIQGMSSLNGSSYPVTVTGLNTLTIPVDGTLFAPYTIGGTISPNPILQQVSINSFPDTYVVPFVVPPQQLVTIDVNWQSNSPNYVSAQAIAQAGGPAIVDYINSLYVGIFPINIYDLQNTFLNAIVNLISSEYITILNFTVVFDGFEQSPEPGTGVIYGDPFSYFYTTITNVIVTQLL